MDFGGALFAQPRRHLIIGNDGGPRAPGHGDRVGQMVLVPVRDQDVIGPHRH